MEIPLDRSRRRLRRRRSILFSSAGCRRDGGKRIVSAIPLFQWKLDQEGSCSGEISKPAGKQPPAASARKLAAGLWHLRFPKVVGALETDLDWELEASVSLFPSSIERVTKWDATHPKLSQAAFDLYDLKLFENQKYSKFAVVSALRLELELAQSKVSELEAERQSAKKKLNHFLKKIEEEKASWRRREHEKIRSVIEAMKDDMNRERNNAQRLVIMNTKLVNELAKTKSSAKQFLLNYEKEKKARELLEEVCNEMAKEIGDDKAEVEALKMESVKTRDEVEEERRMLQMAEVWREERVQMKLIDAKLILEEKYTMLSKLQEEIETFLRSRSGNNYDVSETIQAKLINEVVGSSKSHDMKAFSYYQPLPASNGIFSIYDEHQTRGQSYVSLSPEANRISSEALKRFNNMIVNRNCDTGDDSGWETASHVDEQDPCKSPDGSEPSVNGAYVESRASISGTECDVHVQKQCCKFREVCSKTTKKSKKKGSSLSKLWKSSRASNPDDLKMSFELNNGKLCNATSFNASLSPASAKKADETGLSSTTADNWNFPYVSNELKGCVEWPQPTKKENTKAKVQSQKIQLRQVLKQKI